MDIEVVTRYEDFLSLEDLWDDLLHKTSSNIICLTHDWFKCWWRAYGKNYEDKQNLFVLLIKDKGKYIGIVPLKTSQVKYRGFKINKIGFIESSVSPRLDFILTSKKEECIRKIINFLKGQKIWDVFVLTKLVEASENYKLLTTILEEENITFGTTPSLWDPIIQTDGDWDSFFSARSVKFKKSLRNKLNKAKKPVPLQVEKVSETEDIQNALAPIFDISKKSWKGKTGQAIPDNKMDMNFYTDITDKLGKKGWINIWLLKAEHTPIAYEYHLKYDGVVYPIRADFDENFKKLSPGSILEHSIIKGLFEDKEIKEYDSCAANYQYLKNWTNVFRKHVDIDIFSPGVYSKFLYFYEYGIIPYLKRINQSLSKRQWQYFVANFSKAFQ